jgi:cytochrome d ubiquinol oxidase subunit I
VAAGGAADPAAARSQMGFSLGWDIILACLGVGMPGLAWLFQLSQHEPGG